MKMTREDKGDVVVLRLKGKLLGGPDADDLRDLVHQAVEEGKKSFLLDLSGVPFMNSSGLGILIANLTTVNRADGALKLLSVSKRNMNLFHQTQVIRIFDCYTTEEEALASFGS